MTNNTTKRTLLTSVLSLFLCFTMLVGTTFAWFTDSATSGGNVITAGTLKIDVQYTLDGATWNDLADADDLFQKGLWEPGHTEMVALKIENAGDLALKYIASLNVISETVGKTASGDDIILSEILTVSTLVAENAAEVAAAFASEDGVDYDATALLKDAGTLRGETAMYEGDVHYLVVKVDMADTVGNEANSDGVNVPSIDFDVSVLAAQLAYENDSFGNQYDKDSLYPNSVTANLRGGESIEGNGVTVNLPQGATAGEYTLTVTGKTQQIKSNGDTVLSFDIELAKDGEDIDDPSGISYVVTMNIGEGLVVSKVLHNGEEIDDFSYVSNTGVLSFVTESFSPFAVVYSGNHWDGSVDTSWYNDEDTEFVLTTSAQLAGFAKLVNEGNTFCGHYAEDDIRDRKTVKLGADINLYGKDANGNRICFDPIGDSSNDFCGIFDGDGYTVYNLYQDCNAKHVGFFGAVYYGTVKNVTFDCARIENDGSGYAACVASYAGGSNFENITLKNTVVVNYNHNTGGIVAWCSNNGTTTTFDGINIESTTTIGSWWGSYDTRVGGIVGAMNTGNYVVIKNSKIACRLDVYNDATSNYQWYNYRTAGMVVADVRDCHEVDGRTEANPTRVTCENVEVIFGDWANYHYCESESYGTPSYADEGEYKFHRVEAGLGYGGVDTSACDHAEDETHNLLLEFDFLFGCRDGKGIYGISEFDGVTVTYNND